LLSNSNIETFVFQVKTVFTDELVWISGNVTFSIICPASVTLTASTVDTLQVIALNDVTNGFKLPMITSSNQKCPPSFPQISASGDILTPLAGVKTPVWKTDHYKLIPIDTSEN
jgi:hypothetical protein